MRPAFPINISPDALPIVQTRKALLVLDLQNDFLAPDGALYTSEPEGFVDRTLGLVKAFRDSGAGDVVWVRSEFEHHRPLQAEGERIVTAESLRAQKAPARGRQPTSSAHEQAAMEADEEAFLSVGAGADKKPCVRKGSGGAELAPQVQAAVVAGRDIVFTKTHYSAFASEHQRLVQLLHGRFVTQMFVCGALTNISIYATALDAGRHGYEMTIVEDCCGYRNAMRHLNAVRQLAKLTGSEVVTSDAVLAQLRPTSPRTTGLSPNISSITLEVSSGSPPPAASGNVSVSPAAAAAAAAAAGLLESPTVTRAGSPQPSQGQDEDEDKDQDQDQGRGAGEAGAEQEGEGQWEGQGVGEAKPSAAPPRRRSSAQGSADGGSARPSKDTDETPAHVTPEAESPPSSDSEPQHSHQRQPGEARREETEGSAHVATATPSEQANSPKGPIHRPAPRDDECRR